MQEQEQVLGPELELALVLEQALVWAQQVLLELELVQELAQLVLVWVQQEQVLALQERVQLVLDLELQQALVAEWVLVLELVRLEPEELQAARPRQELEQPQKVTRQVSKGLRQLPLQLPMASESPIPYKI